MRKWMGIPLALLLIIGHHPSALANSEGHPGGRLFFPLWDVSTANRLTFIIITREAMREGASIQRVENQWHISGNPGKCLPRGPFGSTTNVNRIDLGGTATNPVFVDDVHLEYYGRSCISADEIIHMSCGDIDLFFLASDSNKDIKPRHAFVNVAGDRRGALDVHYVTNGAANPRQRKLETSLMGEAIISDLAEGWAASYAAAAAKAVACTECANIDGGTQVGYENYPMETYLPFAFAEAFPIQGGLLRNVLSLWGPGLLPGASLANTSIDIDFKWWDGRERAFVNSVLAHALIRPLGGPTIAGLDPPLDPARFNVANFVCGHTTINSQAENDGFPRTGKNAAACGVPDVADPAHKSDNFENIGDLNIAGHSIQSSTPIGWWRFTLRRDNLPPFGLTGDHSGRGLVGVLLSSAPGVAATNSTSSGAGFATRLWHEDSCEVAQSGETIGPPHNGHRNLSGDEIALFSTFTHFRQSLKCELIHFLAPHFFDFLELFR